MVDDQGVNPRYSNTGRLHASLDRQQRSYRKADPPPDRVKPIPFQLIRHCVEAHQSDEFSRGLADLVLIAVFFLLRPGEHTYDTDNNTPFRLQDVSFQSASAAAVNATTVTAAELDGSDRVHLCFTNQKNGEKGEAITHGDTDDSLFSPLRAVRRRVEHLRSHRAPPTTPLHTVYIDGHRKRIRSSHLTKALRASCDVLGAQLGIKPSEISAHALRASGAMALLRARVDSSTTRLLGRWKSWTMLRYLHRSAMHTTDFAQRMLAGGTYVLSKHAIIPDDAKSLLESCA